MGSNQEIFNKFIRHQLALQTLSDGQAKSILKALDATDDSLIVALQTSLLKIQKTGVFTKARKTLYASLLTKVKKIRGVGFSSGLKDYMKELSALVDYEVEVVENIIKDSLPIDVFTESVAVKKLGKALLTYGVFDGSTIAEYFSKLQEADAARILKEVQRGVSQGLPTEKIVRNIMGSANQGYRNGVNGVTRRSVRSIVRTTINGITSGARKAWSLKNKHMIAHEVYSAVLDGRTTKLCASLDGTQFAIGVGPYPPLHLNCRSLRIPIVNLMRKTGVVGTRPYVRDTRNPRSLRKDFRADAKTAVGKDRWKKATVPQRDSWIVEQKHKWQKEAIGLTDANTTFSQWFKIQPSAFQKKYLGKARYDAYTKGSSLEDFIGNNYKEYTVAELRAKEII